VPEFSLVDLDLVDAPDEQAFDNLTRLASTLLGTPVSLVSIVEKARDRQFFKSRVGLVEPWASRRETPLSHSFCRHVVESAQTLVAGDVREHPLLHDNPAVTELNIAAYLGAPVRGGDETVLGALCVIDETPRQWSTIDIEHLECLAACASDAIRMKTLVRRGALLRREQRDFTYAISHDLKSPLNTLRLILNELVESGDAAADDLSRELISMGRATLGRADTLIEDMLGYTRSIDHEFTPEPVDLAELADGIRADLRAEIERTGAHVEIGPLPIVPGQPTQLRMLLQNLIANALKFVRPGDSPQVKVTATSTEGTVELQVSDEGIGIAPENQARVFELFQRLHVEKDYTGSGLGLSLCRQVVANHGGEIEIRSRPGEGTTFVVRLPGDAT